MFPYAPWLCWLIPIVGAILTPLFALAHRNLRDYAPVAFAGASVIFSFSMMPDVHAGNLVNWQIPWVTSLGINLGVLMDPLSVLMASMVSGVGLLRARKEPCETFGVFYHQSIRLYDGGFRGKRISD